MRARYPDVEGFVERDGGVKIGYEVYGSGEPTILLLTSWAIVHARQWKSQIPYLARHHRVVVVDGRGNGRSDRPAGAGAYADRCYTADAVAVLDAVGADQVVAVGLSLGGRQALELAAWHPDRVLGVVAIGTALPWYCDGFDDVRDAYEGMAKLNRHYFRQDYRGFVEFFTSGVFTEPHSIKQFEDGVSWGLETTAETLIDTVDALNAEPDEAQEICRAVRCPVLVVHGTQDAIVPYDDAIRIAEWTGGELVTFVGAGHAPPLRHPVRTNLLIRRFVSAQGGARCGRSRSWTPMVARAQRRALFICSPIGLGHTRRDLAIADELRALHPDLRIDWLAQHPVTEALARRGEHIHPASYALTSEVAHFEGESAEHDLHAFQAIRTMDETMVANFMVFCDLVDEENYDLWVGDEAWELDYFLHENPELKRAAYAWLTDFVGALPMPDGGDYEAMLTTDYNADMLEKIARVPRIRDRAIFVGNLGDVVTERFGANLPIIREWSRDHFDFPGYITGFDPASDDERAQVRAELGWADGEPVCLVAVGGTGVGVHLLGRVIAAYPAAARRVPGLRMVVVTGPRIDPESLVVPRGVDVHAFLPDLYRHLSACDLAVVHGGLTTAMELTAARRPFLYVPLRHHFEQNFHVRYRLERYRAGRRLDYAELDPDALAAAIAEEIGREVDYLPVETGGAARAAARLAELL